MQRLYALHGILSPFPQRPLCVVGRGWGEGKRENESARGGWGGHRPVSACCFFFLLLFFSFFFGRVEYPFSSREQYKLKSVTMLGIYRPEFARWNFILAKKSSVQSLF